MQRMIYRRVDCFVLTRIWNQYHYLSMIPGVSRQNNSKTLNKEYKSYSGDGNGELNTNNNIIEPEPPRPDECCASGCSICVWDTYETNMEAFQRATAQLDAPFVPHLQVSIRSSDSDNLQLQPANKSSRHEAQRVVQLMPVLLGHAPLDQQEKIRCGTVVKSIEMRKPIPGYDARRYVRDIHVIVKDTEAIPFSYSTADHSAIYSPNSPDVVRRCLKHIVNTTDTIIKSNTIVDVCAIQQTHTQAGKMNSITEEDNSSGLWSSSLSNKSAICTQHDAMENMKITASMQTLLTWGCDLHRTTTRVSTRILAQFAQDENEADELRSIASSEKRYKQIVASQFLGLGQLMEMFPSLKVPLEVILQVGSPVLPRRYTITSAPSSSQSKSSFQLLISGHHDFGKCSSHLTIPSNIFDSSNTSRANEQMTHNDSWLFFQKISSSYPPFVLEPDRPLVMVAAGCGIAPFLSMLRELEFKLHNQVVQVCFRYAYDFNMFILLYILNHYDVPNK